MKAMGCCTARSESQSYKCSERPSQPIPHFRVEKVEDREGQAGNPAKFIPFIRGGVRTGNQVSYVLGWCPAPTCVILLGIY